jgi:hypothetical protein
MTEIVYWMIDSITDQIVGSTHNHAVAEEMLSLFEVTTHYNCRIVPVAMTKEHPWAYDPISARTRRNN